MNSKGYKEDKVHEFIQKLYLMGTISKFNGKMLTQVGIVHSTGTQTVLTVECGFKSQPTGGVFPH